MWTYCQDLMQKVKKIKCVDSKKTFYDLKQLPRAWFGLFATAIQQHGYKQAHLDHTLFSKKQGGKIAALIVCIDDIALIGDDVAKIEKIKRELAQDFEMKDLGSLR